MLIQLQGPRGDIREEKLTAISFITRTPCVLYNNHHYYRTSISSDIAVYVEGHPPKHFREIT
jgi:hypothetical protein